LRRRRAHSLRHTGATSARTGCHGTRVPAWASGWPAPERTGAGGCVGTLDLLRGRAHPAGDM